MPRSMPAPEVKPVDEDEHQLNFELTEVQVKYEQQRQV